MQCRLVRQNLFAALLLATLILSLTPALAHAGQQYLSYPVTIDATGQATAIGNGPSGATTLNLIAVAYKNADQWLILQNTTGAINIAATSYLITGGHGSANQFGDVAIFADTNSGKAQLILHGTMNGNSISFTSPESELASAAYLSLNGTITQNTAQARSLIVNTITSSSVYNAAITSATNQPQKENSTMTSTSLLPLLQNTTETSITNVTSTFARNFTLSAEMTVSNATHFSTLNESVNATSTVQASGNVSATVTEYLSETTSTTRTLANVTISYTTTTTVANTTIIQANATTTVTATTGT